MQIQHELYNEVYSNTRYHKAIKTIHYISRDRRAVLSISVDRYNAAACWKCARGENPSLEFKRNERYNGTRQRPSIKGVWSRYIIEKATDKSNNYVQ